MRARKTRPAISSSSSRFLILLADVTAEEAVDLDTRAAQRRLTEAPGAMRRLADELPTRSEPPASDELHEIARAALHAAFPLDP